jgi:hypothetical protein
MKVLTAIYDLAAAPASYDFVKFLSGTASMQKGMGCDHTHVIFMPADTETGFRIDHKPTSTENKIWRLHNLLVPACRLIGATSTVLPCRDHRLKADIQHPADWTALKPTAAYWFDHVKRIIGQHGFVPFQADPQAAKWCDTWGAKRGEYITTTQRQTYFPACDSDLKEWQRVESWLRANGEEVITIPDTEHASPAHSIGAIAAINPLIRHALYAGAKMNLGVGGGTQALCWFGGLPFISFKMLKDNFNGTKEWYDRWGLPVGSQLPWATDKQRLVWEGSDTFDNIRKHYLEVMDEARAAA